jgi:hypothetical protein
MRKPIALIFGIANRVVLGRAFRGVLVRMAAMMRMNRAGGG